MGNLRFLSAILLFFAFGSVAFAQMIPTTTTTSSPSQAEASLPDPLTPEAIDALVSRMSDGEVRALLLEQLNSKAAPAQAEDEETSFVEFAGRAASGGFGSVVIAFQRLPNLWTNQRQSFVNFHKTYGLTDTLKIIGTIAAALGLGFVVETIVNRLTALRFGTRLSEVKPDTLSDQLRFLFFRLLVDLLGLLAFFVVARNVNQYFIPPELLPLAGVIMINMVVIPRIGLAFLKFILAPRKPEFRIVHTDDVTARRSYRQMAMLLIFMGFSIAICSIPDDHIDPRRSALFMARSILNEVRDGRSAC